MLFVGFFSRRVLKAFWASEGLLWSLKVVSGLARDVRDVWDQSLLLWSFGIPRSLA